MYGRAVGPQGRSGTCNASINREDQKNTERLAFHLAGRSVEQQRNLKVNLPRGTTRWEKVYEGQGRSGLRVILGSGYQTL